MKKLKDELLKQIKISLMIIITSMVYTWFKSQFVSSLWGFLLCNGHADTKNSLFRKQLMYFNVYITGCYFCCYRKHQNKWFFDFQNNWTLKFKFEVCFLVFILTWKTKNQIYLNKYLMKLLTIPLTQSK